jgi:hypothetical protein
MIRASRSLISAGGEAGPRAVIADFVVPVMRGYHLMRPDAAPQLDIVIWREGASVRCWRFPTCTDKVDAAYRQRVARLNLVLIQAVP